MGATTLVLTPPVKVMNFLVFSKLKLIIYVKIKISFLEKIKSLGIGCVSSFECWGCGIDIFVPE